jgi:hypothetical protein
MDSEAKAEDVHTEVEYFIIDARGKHVKVSKWLRNVSSVVDTFLQRWNEKNGIFYVDADESEVHKMLDSIRGYDLYGFLDISPLTRKDLTFAEKFDIANEAGNFNVFYDDISILFCSMLNEKKDIVMFKKISDKNNSDGDNYPIKIMKYFTYLQVKIWTEDENNRNNGHRFMYNPAVTSGYRQLDNKDESDDNKGKLQIYMKLIESKNLCNVKNFDVANGKVCIRLIDIKRHIINSIFQNENLLERIYDVKFNTSGKNY